ncbi:MAG: DUF2914 domain-containing protein [Gammaproteobacteria bacterium]|jgi:hypothetical protein
MTQFTNDYFRDLPPRDRRYDTPVADQLVFRVFPNGVKAWVHVYPCDDFVRRRTMGLFPEMDYGAALAALEESRRIADVDTQQTRRRRPVAVHRSRYIFVGLLATLLTAETIYLFSRPDQSRQAHTLSGTQAYGDPAASSPTGDMRVTVARAMLTSEIRDREPVDRLSGSMQSSDKDTLTVYFFTELRGGDAGEMVLHRWQHNGITVTEVPFRIGDTERGRVFSKRIITAEDAGDWMAAVVDQSGRIIESRSMKVMAPRPGQG